MKVYYDERLTHPTPRLFPYGADKSGKFGFVDFKKHPERIRDSLEDFLPHSERPAVQTFYSMLAWINGPESYLETSDCAFRSAAPHRDSISSLKLSAHGRLYLLYRDMRLNCSQAHVDWLCKGLMSVLGNADTAMSPGHGVCGFTLNPVLHTDLSEGHWNEKGEFDSAEDDPGHGQHLMISFWAYGDTEEEVFQNLERLFKNLHGSCVTLSSEIKVALAAERQSAG